MIILAELNLSFVSASYELKRFAEKALTEKKSLSLIAAADARKEIKATVKK